MHQKRSTVSVWCLHQADSGLNVFLMYFTVQKRNQVVVIQLSVSGSRLRGLSMFL